MMTKMFIKPISENVFEVYIKNPLPHENLKVGIISKSDPLFFWTNGKGLTFSEIIKIQYFMIKIAIIELLERMRLL